MAVTRYSDEDKIYGFTNECKNTFQLVLSNTDLGSCSDFVHTQHKSFRAWIAITGALAPVQASLDHRLREHRHIKLAVVELLILLKDCLEAEPCQTESYPGESEGDNSKAEKPQVLINQHMALEKALECLHQLASSIRRASIPNSQFDLSARFSKGGKVYDPSFEGFAKLLVKYRFPLASESLCEQLGASMSRRRNWLLYNHRHAQKLSLHDERGPHSTIAQPPSALVVADRNQTGGPTVSLLLSQKKQPRVAQIPLPAYSETVGSRLSVSNKLMNWQAPSSVSSKRTGISLRNDIDYYPPVPKFDQGDRFCLCPNCFKSLHTEKLKKSYWRKHYDDDTRPFVCLSEECDDPLQFFSRLDTWERHMVEQHSTDWAQTIHSTVWYCDIDECRSDEKIFYSSREFEEHMRSKPKQNYSATQISALMVRKQRDALRDAMKCPLCEMKIDTNSEHVPSLAAHVGGHLHYLTGLCVPQMDASAEEANSESQSVGKKTERDSHTNSKADLLTDTEKDKPSFQDENHVPEPGERAADTYYMSPEWAGSGRTVDRLYFVIQDYEPLRDTVLQSIATHQPPQRDGIPEGVSKQKDTSSLDLDARKSEASNAQQILADDYTVGWICSMSPESIAAQAFLDEIHDRAKFRFANDTNSYVLGKIGKHNVVIADESFKNAFSLWDMMHSFRNIRIVLIVGIGGGAPSSKHDIRLGDIVVSAASPSNRGAFWYDFDKTIQEGRLQGTKFLQPPTMDVLVAVQTIKANYEREGHLLEESINSIIDNEIELQEKYKRPDSSADSLFKPHITHSSSCATDCIYDPLNLIPRQDRRQEEIDPAVHYGTIAISDNKLMNALLRDRLGEQEDVLCFHVGRYDLMGRVPCLIICGICDYSDSHMNDKWHGYAAMAAAAYARGLLYQIRPDKVRVTVERSSLLSSAHDGSKSERDRDLEILKWLAYIDYESQQARYRDIRLEGTCQWFLDSPEFQNWLRHGNQTLFCPGRLGVGKTILTSIVVDHLVDRFRNDVTVGIAYIYFNFSDQENQNVAELLGSLSKQLLRSQSSLPHSLKSLYDKHKESETRPSSDTLARTLQSIVLMYSRVFIVIDALDECPTSNGRRSRFMSEIFNLRDRGGANILVTSRVIPDIKKMFDTSRVLEIYTSHEDIMRYLEENLLRLPLRVRQVSDLPKEFTVEFFAADDVIFLLASLYLDSFRYKTSPQMFQADPQILPTDTLDNMYRSEMERVERQDFDQQRLAIQVLSWITCAERPLEARELQHALAVKPGQHKLNEENLPDIGDMISVCAGLVTVDEESDVIQLFHLTAEEYLERTHMHWFPNSDSEITSICVTYLSFRIFESICDTEDELMERLQSNPFYAYAACNWGYHARKATILPQEVMEFLKKKGQLQSSFQAFLDAKESSGFFMNRQYSLEMTELSVAAYFGIEEAVKALCQTPIQADAEAYEGRKPLLFAAKNGHDPVVAMLLNTNNVDPDSRDYDGRTPLSYAAENGHNAVAAILLERGNANVDSKDGKGRTPLSLATEKGHEAVIHLLLNRGAEVDSKDNRYWTPLFYAVLKNKQSIIELLLDAGADLNSRTKRGETPLSVADEVNDEALIDLLHYRRKT